MRSTRFLISSSPGRPVAARPHAQAEGHVLEHAHVPEQRVMLEHEADPAFARAAPRGAPAFETDVAGMGELEAGDDAQKRRLARARGAEQRARNEKFCAAVRENLRR
jgi:hypothetical protein